MNWIILSNLFRTSCLNFLVSRLSAFLVTLFSVTVRITSPKMLILSPVTDFPVLSVFSKVGSFNFRQVYQFIIVISESESSWNLMELLKILTFTYFFKFLLTVSSDWACLILLYCFLILLAYQHWVKWWSFLLQFLQYFFLLYWTEFHPMSFSTLVTRSRRFFLNLFVFCLLRDIEH